MLKFMPDAKKSDITPDFRALMDLTMPPPTDGFSSVVRRLDALYFEDQNINIPIIEMVTRVNRSLNGVLSRDTLDTELAALRNKYTK